MAKTYRFEFDVTGALGFPIDMLRYDRCTPATEQDSSKILDSISNPLSGQVCVRICAQGKPKSWQPTHGRWDSFGWRVGAHNTFTTRQEE